ncbi:MAG: thioredoxin-dependent thiol peroxidase [Actinobacteria bacterium]|uniref:thioredoxin-dependent peroxiredoxin n=1 Tax=freshwater metagenome TaxID=449393 RepID=A0A6J7D6P4_9ZZZZ|nr:thioredoxin-dependent thiol peroxidase [Actinomycetota bacterium]
MKLEIGSKAPAFTLTSDDGSPVSLADFTGRKALLYFYPAALTPGCTKQACDFRDNLEMFDSADYVIVGISPDKQAKLVKFRETETLPFTLLSDPDHAVMEAYGAWGHKQLYGKTVTGVIRSTIVVGPTGLVEVAQYNVRATGHVAKLMRDLSLS